MRMAEAAAAVILLLNSITDLRRREILLRPTLIAAAAGALYAGAVLHRPLLLWIPAFLPGLAGMLLAVMSAGKLGMGDALVILACGIWLGGLRMLEILTAAMTAAAAAGTFLYLRKRKKRDLELPFVPFLLAGLVLTALLQQAGG